jgi:hypothetical protein
VSKRARAPLGFALGSYALVFLACSANAPYPTATPSAAGYATATRTSTDCTTGVLAITEGSALGQFGQVGVPLLFRNSGTEACLLRGYPTVEAVDAVGGKVTLQQTPSGPLGGLSELNATPPTIELRPGATASALVEGTNAVDAGADGGAGCTPYAALLVTPPNATGAVKVVTEMTACGAMAVHPVVEGARGSQ